MKVNLIFFGLCFLTHVNGNCDTQQYVSPNLKFLKIVTKGTYQVRKSDREVKDGQEVYLYCSNKTYLYDTIRPSKVKCENSIFDRNLPACYPSCDEPVYDASTTTIQCTSTDCNGRQVVGTKIDIICRHGFEFPKRAKKQITCSYSGWDNPLYSCGTDKEQIKQVGFIFGGETATSNASTAGPQKAQTRVAEVGIPISNLSNASTAPCTAPWQVGIYLWKEQPQTYQYHCGGSLISPFLVATAGHCFSKEIMDKNLFKVVYGSLNSEYDENDGQHFNIRHIEFADGINVEILKNDFAIVVLDKPVKDPNIVNMPDVQSIFSFGTKGILAGFGITGTTDFYSQNLMYTNLIIKECKNYTKNLCIKLHISRKKLEKCLTNPDLSVFCPTHELNSSAPCQGDRGSGLVVKHNRKNYLAGVVSGVLQEGHNTEGGCEPRSDVIFSDARSYYGLFEKVFESAKNNVYNAKSSNGLHRKSCPGSEVSCGELCIALEDLCTGNCKNIPDKEQCKLRATHQMLTTGLNLLKFIGSQRDFTSYTFPNWIVPSASLWSLFNFFSEASDTNISDQLQRDFGVALKDNNVNKDYRKMIKNAHIVSSASYTRTDIFPHLFNEHFRHVREKPQRDDWFYSATEDRVTTVLDYDFNHSFQYLGKRLEFVTFERQTIDTVMICSVSDHKILKWEKFADVIDVAINASTRLMMIKPEDPRESLDSVMNALKKWPIHDLRNLAKDDKQVGVCFPRFKVLIDTDYSPILFKMGYDYLFTPTRIDLTNVGATNVRIQTQVRAFIKIWDAENDYDDPTAPYDFDITSHYIVDKPFVFILYDSKTNLPWIVGKINNPGMFRHYTSSASSYKLFP